jgi:tRNA pseudouridine38-40 synthase
MGDSERRLKLLIEYDGTDFVGWQIQKTGRSVQETIQAAFKQFTGQPAIVVGSGRTDSGVHARGQVAHAVIKTDYPCEKIYEALNGILPDDIAILEVGDTDDTFHARYSALQRRYSYTISTAPCAIDRKVAWYVRYRLNMDVMNECSSSIIGVHDFRAFTKTEAEVDNFQCTVTRAEWNSRGNKFIFRIDANRFLHNMVRAMVGSMVDVGRGYVPVEWFLRALETGSRKDAGPTAPPVGLVLEEVLYTHE